MLRSRHHRWLAGVCGGIAEHMGWSTFVVRVLFVVLGLHVGLGLLLYLAMAVLVPLEDEDETRI